MLKTALRRPIAKQFSAFILVGITSTVLNYLVFLILLIFISLDYLLSAGTGFVAGVLLGFIFNRNYTYKSNSAVVRSLPLYFLVYSFSLLVNLGLLQVLVTSTDLGAIISNALLAPLIIIINFLGTKIVAFNNRKW